MECKDGRLQRPELLSAVLIETYWNVKNANASATLKPLCINRNILECKGRRLIDNTPFGLTGINRNILECKDQPERILFRFTDVLIETYWNVKLDGSQTGKIPLAVLIETYWNVKFIQSFLDGSLDCINRNILECKGWSLTASRVTECCINRNILECKVGCICKIYAVINVLIETYWNVKMGKHYGYGLSQWVLIETYWNVK